MVKDSETLNEDSLEIGRFSIGNPKETVVQPSMREQGFSLVENHEQNT